MYKLVETSNNNKLILIGSYDDCIGKFHSLSNFSYQNHKKFSNNTFDIIKLKNQ